MTRIGWVGSVPPGMPPEGMSLHTYDGADASVLTTADVDVWVVDGGVPERVQRAVATCPRPVLVRAKAEDMGGWWWPLLRDGRVEVVGMTAGPHEVLARLQGATQRALAWNALSGRLATTAAHDLRSPLQGLRFTLASLERSDATEQDRVEDLEMIRAVADAMELQLHGLYNLGRKLAPDRGETLDLAAALQEEVVRPMFSQRFDVVTHGALVVRCHPNDMRYALLDLLRVAAQVGPGSRRVALDARAEGGFAVVMIEVPVYAVIGPHVDALRRREGPLLLRGQVRMPFAGLAFAADVVEAASGTLLVEMVAPERLALRVRLPLVSEA